MSNLKDFNTDGPRPVTVSETSITKDDTDNRIVDSDGHVFLVPTPSADPADPLNWSPTRKWTIVVLLIIWSATALSVQSFLTNFLPSLESRFPDASASQINLLITIVTPLIVPGELFFAPLAIGYGRRPSLLLSIVLLFASSIWGAQSKTYSALLGARVIEGFAGGPTDAIGFTIIQDFTFVHERGKMLGVMMMGQQALTLVLAIATNYMAVDSGFSAPFYLFFGLSIAVFVALFFAMPETKYDRQARDIPEERMTTKEYPEWRKSLGRDPQYPPFTWKRQLRVWGPAGRAQKEEALGFLKGLMVMLTSPVIWWASLLNAVSTGALIAFSTCFATMLVSPPWSWPSANVGLINIAGTVSSLINVPLLGIGSDKLSLRLAARNGGVARLEHRLAGLVIPVAIGVAANIGFGALAQKLLVTGGAHQPHWFSLVFIFALQYMYFGGILEVTYTYVASTVSPARSLEAMTAISVIRDMVSFGMSYGVVGFADNCGYLASFGTYSGIVGFFGCLGLLVYRYGGMGRLKI
ncbi:hypothetical protein LTR85_008262 [Meristemomyces frigidus]|nr:hypothetical protein LTR85_008262 [Meristemomyces frigidus]